MSLQRNVVDCPFRVTVAPWPSAAEYSSPVATLTTAPATDVPSICTPTDTA